MYIAVGLFDGDEGIERTFKSSVTMVNKKRHEDDELPNVYLLPEMHEVESNMFEVSTKGEAFRLVARDKDLTA